MSPPRVVVVGGGIAGLAAALRLAERGVALTLVEAAPRLGGTIRTEVVDGFVLEAGPDSFLSEKPWALALAERVGLGPRLRPTDERYRRTYVVHGGRLHPLPEGFLLLAPTRLGPLAASSLFSWRGKLRMAMDLVLPRGGTEPDESLASFVRRRLGREALERVAEPLVAGIYTADPARLSLAATLPRFRALEREHRSLVLGLRRTARAGERVGASGARWSLFVTLAGGMEELVTTLAGRLPPASLRLGRPALALARGGAEATWTVHLAGGGRLPADAVILAGPAPQMAGVVAPVDAVLADRLRAIPYVPAATVTLAYPRAAVRHPLDGFGFVVPRREGRVVLACTFSSVKYPGRAPEGFALLRAFLGGAEGAAWLEADDAALVSAVHGDLQALLGVGATPVLTRVARHPAAMPQYEVGHLARVAAIEARLEGLPGVALAGAAYRGVGIADCVRSGEVAADRVLGALGAGGAPTTGERL